MVNRLIELPKKQSFFLFGPRQTGKSTLVEKRFTKNIWKVNLLYTDVFLKYSKDPARFRYESVEKIEKEKIKFIFVD